MFVQPIRALELNRDSCASHLLSLQDQRQKLLNKFTSDRDSIDRKITEIVAEKDEYDSAIRALKEGK